MEPLIKAGSCNGAAWHTINIQDIIGSIIVFKPAYTSTVLQYVVSTMMLLYVIACVCV
jgi:hypothetical protein